MHERGKESLGAMLSRQSRTILVAPDVLAAKACFACTDPRSLSPHAFAARLSRTTGGAADGRESMAPSPFLSRHAIAATRQRSASSHALRWRVAANQPRFGSRRRRLELARPAERQPLDHEQIAV